jgi:fermentation-respiration switch protein FrsA (DUF1100 family)
MSGKFKKRMISLLVVLLSLYVLVLIAAYFFQEKLMFFPQKLPANYQYSLGPNDKEVFIKTSDGETINGILFTKPGNSRIVLYFHGNGGALDSWQDVWPKLYPMNCNLLVIDYRGYGKSTGKFSEEGFYKDAEASYDYLTSNGYSADNIIIYGRSLGTGIAIDLALHRKAKAIILESPYSSIEEIANEKFPYLFPSLYIKYVFNSLAKAPQLSIPVLIFHGDHDELISYRHAEKLYAAINSKKTLVIIKGGGHNNLSSFPEHHDAMVNFLSTL